MRGHRHGVPAQGLVVSVVRHVDVLVRDGEGVRAFG